LTVDSPTVVATEVSTAQQAPNYPQPMAPGRYTTVSCRVPVHPALVGMARNSKPAGQRVYRNRWWNAFRPKVKRGNQHHSGWFMWSNCWRPN